MTKLYGVWYECLVVKRFALPAEPAHLIQVIAFASLAFVNAIPSQSVTKPVKHIAVQNVE